LGKTIFDLLWLSYDSPFTNSIMIGFLKILGTIVLVLLLLFAMLYLFVSKKSKAESIARFIRKNPEKSAIYLVQNGKVLVEHNADRVMPLASTVKIVIAIEYAEQVGKGTISPDSMIDLSELDKYYIAKTDGGAHPSWLEVAQKGGLIKNEQVSIREVAKGMINYSSNANTEFLMDLLGLDQINANLQKMGLTHHQPLYPIVSALFLHLDKSPEQVRALSDSEYIAATQAIHETLKFDGAQLKKQYKPLSMTAQRVWSDRLVGGTTREYASILKKINDRDYFSEKAQSELDLVMEGILENPANRAWLLHAGMKGGSTAFVLTQATYACTIKGEKTELAYFFDDLTTWQGVFLEMGMNAFELEILSNPTKREKLLKLLLD
jgi:D-alanyl-D-alanine carboxypeptidase